MSDYRATIRWSRDGAIFTDYKYGRGHSWSFDGGVVLRASSSPHSVPRYSDPAGVDPEEAYVASLSSCHMLTFLYIAAKQGFIVDNYVDEAVGAMSKNAAGKYWVSKVTLHPAIAFSGDKQPDRAALNALHRRAHEECFIANSVKTEVVVEPPM